MKAYEDCLNATSTENSPWYVIPADDKKNSRLIISKIILDTLKSLQLTYPVASEEHRQELQDIRNQLTKENL